MRAPIQNSRGSVSVEAPSGLPAAALAGNRSIAATGERVASSAKLVSLIAKKAGVTMPSGAPGVGSKAAKVEDAFHRYMNDASLSKDFLAELAKDAMKEAEFIFRKYYK